MSNLSKVILGTGNYYDVKSGNTVSVTGDGGNAWGYFGPAYKKLAPKLVTYTPYAEKLEELEKLKEDVSKLKEYVEFRKQIEDEYIRSYYDIRLKDLDVKDLLYILNEKFGNDIILLCHEPIDEFCHRRIIADYIELETGIYIPEVSVDEQGNVKKLVPIRYKNRLKEVISKNKYLVKDDLPIKTLEEEYNMFINFYSNILNELQLDESLAKDIAYDKVYNNSEYLLYDDVKDVLNVLNKKYKLIMLTNNFPSIIDYLKNEDIYDLFDKVYVSSICETSKNEEKFFDMVINDYNIKENEALFIDDFEDNLDIGIRKKLNVVMLDRENKKESKYKKISNLVELEKIL